MKKYAFYCAMVIFSLQGAYAQKTKLVIGIVVDQMRWDYLHRFENKFAPDGGFKRLLKEGFSCDETYIPYIPTVTAAGHASIYTGSTPAIHGIVGNFWYDNVEQKTMYCVQDDSVQSVGCNNDNGKMSPKNLWVTTITDELKLASNFKSKVIGISLKDRGAILPAGHCPDAAYWYDTKTGNFITSSFYMKTLPQWLKTFNNRKIVDSLYTLGWNTLYDISTYTESQPDAQDYEATAAYSSPNKAFGENVFPYDLKKFIGKDYHILSYIPQGNNLLVMLAQAIIDNEKLGKRSSNYPDFLAISFSTPDYVGHTFGPNSVEIEDVYLRLDKLLGEFFNYLDRVIGKGNYTLFLTADHGVAHNQKFLSNHHIPAGVYEPKALASELNKYLVTQFHQNDLIARYQDEYIYLNTSKIDSLQLDINNIKNKIIRYLTSKKDIYTVIDEANIQDATIPYSIINTVKQGYTPQRCGDLYTVFKSGWVSNYYIKGAGHSTWYNYDAHIPLIFYGNSIKNGVLKRTVYMNDIAPTIGALLNIQKPSGATGDPIQEIFE